MTTNRLDPMDGKGVYLSRSKEVKGVFGLNELQNHSTVQVQRDYFPKYVNRETTPPHAVLTVIRSPRQFPSPKSVQITCKESYIHHISIHKTEENGNLVAEKMAVVVH